MPVTVNINKYIENSKVQGRFIRWDKSFINVYVTPITHNIDNKNFYYSEIHRAVEIWNRALKTAGINVEYNIINTPEKSDVVIHWIKVGRVFEGMCNYPSIVNGIIRKISIDVGLKNEYSPKNTTEESIFFVIMHELGHALGLGHGVDVNDLMYVPHQKNISTPSENDIYVLKQIYQ